MPSSINPESDPEVTATITAETETHVVMAVEIARCLQRHWRLLGRLAAIGKREDGPSP